MAVLAVNEILPRSITHRIGAAPEATRTFIATVDKPTNHQDVANAIGIFHGSAHPEFSFLKCDNVALTETDRHHAEVVYTYSLTSPQGGEPGQLPIAAPDVWSFSTITEQSAATYAYARRNITTNGQWQGPEVGIFLPLANAAGDPFEGLTKQVPLLRAVITGYRQTFPLFEAKHLTATVNMQNFAGGEPNTWLCTGISGKPERTLLPGLAEVFEYWSITVELLYNSFGHSVFVPNAGFNYLEGGVQNKKKRCWVIDEETGEKLPSANAMALSDNGDLKQVGAGPYPPDLWEFRIYNERNFSLYFGNPPSTVAF